MALCVAFYPMHITHRFTPGLRFDTFWRYLTYTPSGEAYWAHLPLSTGARDAIDPNGAWWCSRRCAAVLLHRPWQAMRMPSGLPAQPSATEVTQVMEQLLPGWQVLHHTQSALNDKAGPGLIPPCAQALEQGGSAVLLLHCTGRKWLAQRTFWAWVVGIEMQERQETAYTAQRISRALLTVPFGWPMPWSSGYTARVWMHSPGECQVDGIYGQWRQSRCLAAIAVSPATAY